MQPRAFDFDHTADDQVSERGSIERSIPATGSVEALVTVDVSSQLSGQISVVDVDFNSPVAKGDLLAAIDPRTFATRVASADSNLAIAATNIALQEATADAARRTGGGVIMAG